MCNPSNYNNPSVVIFYLVPRPDKLAAVNQFVAEQTFESTRINAIGKGLQWRVQLLILKSLANVFDL